LFARLIDALNRRAPQRKTALFCALNKETAVIDPEDFPQGLRPGLAVLAADMAAHGTRRVDPPREVMAMLGDRWTSLILQVLMIGTWRHADLKRALAALSEEQAISQRVLTLKLRALERDGFVTRHATADVPPRVSYALTALGLDLAHKARDMIDWANDRSDMILQARAAFDQRGG
jgi:DNA-binding HxlR family transcriptional regulator